MKKGLILEGGAMRGLFTAGITDVMMENGIVFDGAVGVSAGAAFGCNYKSGQIGRAARYNIKYAGDPRYCSLRNLVKTGDLFGVDFCYKKIPLELDVFDTPAFTSNPMDFYTVATDCETGKAVYHKCYDGLGDDLLHIQASASMPLVSKIVEVGGLKLLDGGIADSVPLRFFEKMGYDRNIVILTQPADYRKEKSSMLPVMKLVLRKYPKVVEAMARRHEIYNETLEYIAKREAEGAVLVIRPENALPIKRLEKDPEVLKSVYETGRAEGKKQLSRIIEYLSE
ncbi:MAG: patatin family protein [Clostridia bacterium]|nr:patatin family protein [Clostridia bacterium]